MIAVLLETSYDRMVEEVITRARRLLREGPPLRLAVLFGSRAKARARPDSDVDIAVVPGPPAFSFADEFDIATSLSRGLGREVDVVRADRASTLLRWHIARDGVLLVADPAWEWPRFRASAASEYAEIAEALDHAARRFRRHILGQAA